MTPYAILAVFATLLSAALFVTLVMAWSREKALRASEERFAKIFHTSPDAINVTARDSGVCLDLNPSYVKLFGYTREEVLGHSVLPGDLGIWAHREDRERFIDGLKAHGEVLGFEAPARRKDGSLFTMLISSCLMEVDGQPCNLSITRDITERVQAEAERRRLQEERQHSEKLESLGSLAGGMAHDMNNVLAGILGTAEMLWNLFPPGDPVARSLESIVHAGVRGRDLVRALTDFARKGLAEPQLFDLNEVLRREVELLNHATLRVVQVVMDLDPFLPLLLGDPSALGSTVMTLAVNALDAMPEGGTLTLRTRVHTSGRLELTVADTGQGMTAEVQARATEPFFTTKPVGRGTGLGLARAGGTVKAHGGSMEIRSAPGQGTTIVILLPSFQSDRTDEPISERAFDRVERGDCLRILLVDDDPVILETMPPLLESLGHRVVETAALGRQALAHLRAGLQVDLVVLDHNMPGLTGTETLARLREIRPDLPVVLATGFVDAFTENLVTSLPLVWILKKPYNLREIRKALAGASAVAAGV